MFAICSRIKNKKIIKNRYLRWYILTNIFKSHRLCHHFCKIYLTKTLYLYLYPQGIHNASLYSDAHTVYNYSMCYSSNKSDYFMPDTSIRVRVPTGLHEKFALTCKENDMTASQVIRAAMRNYIDEKQLIKMNYSEKKNEEK
jgi:hypothetical protein